MDGTKHVLGLWIEQTEGAKFWMRVMNELKNRGLTDILIAVVDGLKGFPEAIKQAVEQLHQESELEPRVETIVYSDTYGRDCWKPPAKQDVTPAPPVNGADGRRSSGKRRRLAANPACGERAVQAGRQRAPKSGTEGRPRCRS